MSKKIVLIFWGHPYFDGRCMNMLSQLVNEGHKISVLGIGKKAQKLQYNGIKIYLMDENKFMNPLTKYFKYFKCVKNFIKSKKIDVIIASDLYSMIPVANIKKQHKAKIVYDSRELYTKLAALKNKPIIQKIWNIYEKKYIPYIDYTLVTAKIDKDYLIKLYGSIKIKIVKNLPSTHFLNPQSINLKKILCIEENKNILIYQGKFHKGRGIKFIIQCIAKINDAVLVLIGDGPKKNIYIETAKHYQVEDKIFFVDAVPYEELAKFSSSGYIGLSMIQPISKSYEHALPNKLFEYAVTGIPVICSNLKAMKEMVDEYKTGIAIEHNNQESFIEAYKKIIENYNQYILNEKKRQNLLWVNNNNINKIIHE